ncbi:MAG: ornithine carbamoyltransferase [Dehalococcoidales bacterium]|nr:ornithine carbamoyltransferase [Dehalococcoidales bacterium]
MKGHSFLSISDMTADEIHSLIYAAVKSKQQPWSTVCERKTLAILFEKPSMRTRVSFEMAMRQLGGQTIYLSQAEVGLGSRESIPDVARVMSRFVDVLAVRTFAHSIVEELAEYAGVPVINALTDYEHPCQTLADFITIYEKKQTLKGLTLAYIGDGNNVANSLILGAAIVGMNFTIAAPEGYSIQPDVLEKARRFAGATGAKFLLTTSPEEAVKGADIVYTDVWASMGQEGEAEKRKQIFAGYQVNARLMSLADSKAVFMHDLPAHRGEEVTADVMESPQSVIFDQAENRLHAQRELIAHIFGKR